MNGATNRTNRKNHVLQQNKANQRPCYVIFFDCETRPIAISDKEDIHVLRLGWACFTRTDNTKQGFTPEWLYFTDTRSFWRFVEKYARPNRKLYLVAHNIAFDFRIVNGFEYTKANRWHLSFFYNRGKTCLLTYRKGNTTLQLLDMTNFFPMSLHQVGEAVGVRKQSVDFANVDDQPLSVYCHRDVEVLVKAWDTWIAFLDTHDLGNFRHTLPAQAFNAFRHRFMKHKIHIHNNERICDLEREAYRGGRTEVFWKGRRTGGEYFQLDVNSMYAYVMQQRDYPAKFIQSRETMSVWKLRNMVKIACVVARVDIETEEPCFPVHTGTRNIYPIGAFKTTLTTPELRYALDHNMVKRVGLIAWYRKRPIFQEYSTYFADLKEQYGREENTAFRTIAKLFGNSLYGKFGQLGMKTTIRPDVPESQRPYEAIVEVTRIMQNRNRGSGGDHPKAGRKLTTRRAGRSYRLGGDYVIEQTGGESYNSFPAIAAHVTAYARMFLWQLIRMAGRNNVYYTDTDCLMVNRAGYDHLRPLLDNHALGYLKIEKQANTLTIHAAKDYQLGDKVRIKGIRKNAEQLGPNLFEQIQFLGLSGAIQRESPDLVTIRQVRKTLAREVKTGLVGNDGWVKPFRLPL